MGLGGGGQEGAVGQVYETQVGDTTVGVAQSQVGVGEQVGGGGGGGHEYVEVHTVGGGGGGGQLKLLLPSAPLSEL